MAAGVVILVLVLIAVFLAASTIKTVPQGWEYTVQRFGRYTRTLKPASPSSPPSSRASGGAST